MDAGSESLVNFCGNKSFNSLSIGRNVYFLYLFKNKIIFNFVKFMTTKKVEHQIPPLLLLLLLDPGSDIGKNQDPRNKSFFGSIEPPITMLTEVCRHFTNFELRPILGLDPCFTQPEETATHSIQARNYFCPGELYFLIVTRKDVHPFFRAEQCCGSGTKKDPHEFAR